MALRGLFRKSEKRYKPLSFREPKKLVVIPGFKSASKVDVRYPLIDPHAHARIKWSQKEKSLLYSLEEPGLRPAEHKAISSIEEALREVIDVKLESLQKDEKTLSYLQGKVVEAIDELGLTLGGKPFQRVMYYIARDFIGLNEIEPLMHDPYIEDIGCNGVGSPIYVVHKVFGSIRTNLTFRDNDYLSDLVIKIAERCGRYISYASPLLDGSLPDGSRVQASLAKDVTTKGPSFSIRKFRSHPFSPIDLLNMGTVSSSMLAYLWLLCQYNVSIMICGGVSTGKTTFLNAISMFIPPEDKIISIEDTREINLPHDNWIPSVSRRGFGMPEANGKRYGEIGLYDLLRESFRQNPSYVVVGEVRGKEAYVMFQGMASGHASLGTIHAGSVEDVIKRLSTPPIELSPSLLEALDAMVVMTNAKEKGKSSRRVKRIVEIQSVDSHTGRAHTKESFSWIPSEDVYRESTGSSEILQRISFEEGLAFGRMSEELERRKKVIEWMQAHSVVYFHDVCRIINLYYKDQPTVMKWVRENRTPFKKERVKKAENAEKHAKEAASKKKPRPRHKPGRNGISGVLEDYEELAESELSSKQQSPPKRGEEKESPPKRGEEKESPPKRGEEKESPPKKANPPAQKAEESAAPAQKAEKKANPKE